MEVQWKCNGSAVEVKWKCNGSAVNVQAGSAELFRVCTKSGIVPTQVSLVSVCVLCFWLVGVGVGEFGLDFGVFGRFCLV